MGSHHGPFAGRCRLSVVRGMVPPVGQIGLLEVPCFCFAGLCRL